MSFGADGRALVFSVIFLTFAFDTFAFVFGSFLINFLDAFPPPYTVDRLFVGVEQLQRPGQRQLWQMGFAQGRTVYFRYHFPGHC